MTLQNNNMENSDLNNQSKIKKYIYSHIKIPCKYIPPCRKCGSTATGFYIRSSSMNVKANPIIKKIHLIKGEYVEVINEISDSSIIDRCYCSDCKIEWTEYFPTIWVSLYDLQHIKREKCISNDLISYYKNFNKNYEMEMKQKKKEEKKQKKKQKKAERKLRNKLW